MSELMTLWGAAFERHYPTARVALDDAGIEEVSGGAVTLGPWLGRMGEPTIGSFKAHFGCAAMEVPVCLYVLGVFVHPDNPLEGGLSVEKVPIIFASASRDLTWDDLGFAGDWFNRPIITYVPRGHAKWLIWERFRSGFFKESANECPDDAAVVTAVAKDLRAIGLASIGRRTDKVRALAIAPKDRTEVVLATADNARNGSYPLADVFHLVLNHDPKGVFELDPLRREFLRYILSKQGQEAVVKAGHVALSAEQAEQALARFGIRPTGEGSWDEMVLHLYARALPAKELAKIEQLTRSVGDRPSDEQLAILSNRLANTKLTSSVVVATDEKGAVVKYRLFGQPLRTLDQAGVEIKTPIGLYNIWTERDGKATSPTDAWFQVIREHERIKIFETRETARPPMDDELPGR